MSAKTTNTQSKWSAPHTVRNMRAHLSDWEKKRADIQRLETERINVLARIAGLNDQLQSEIMRVKFLTHEINTANGIRPLLNAPISKE